VSGAYYRALDDIRRELRVRRGYAPREVSYGNLAEIAVELLREHVFGEGGYDERRDDERPGRSAASRRGGGG